MPVEEINTNVPYVGLYNAKARKRYKDNARRAAKHTLKFMGDWSGDPHTTASIVRSAPPEVIKGISNTALNILHNPDIRLTPAQKRIFRKYRATIALLASRKHSLRRKRQHLLTQEGGAFPILGALLPFLIKTGITLLGSSILGKALSGNSGDNQQQ